MTRKTVARTAPAFTPIESALLNEITESLPERIVPSGVNLCEQSAFPPSIAFIHRGMVKLVYTSEDGVQKMLGLRSSGWFAGAAHVLTKTLSTCSVTTVTPCTVSLLDADILDDWLKLRPAFSRHLLRTLAQEVVSTRELVKQLMFASAEDRLRSFLREQESSAGSEDEWNRMPRLKQGEIAQLLSITPEHLSRLQKKIQDRG